MASEDEIFGCLSKVRFTDEHVARARTAQLIDADRTDSKELWVYQCTYCRGWHMTKMRQPGQASIVAGDLFHKAGR